VGDGDVFGGRSLIAMFGVANGARDRRPPRLFPGWALWMIAVGCC
jgi:hypothetical protein